MEINQKIKITGSYCLRRLSFSSWYGLTEMAEDETLYEKYFTHAAAILALVKSGAEKEPVQNEVNAHVGGTQDHKPEIKS